MLILGSCLKVRFQCGKDIHFGQLFVLVMMMMIKNSLLDGTLYGYKDRHINSVKSALYRTNIAL